MNGPQLSEAKTCQLLHLKINFNFKILKLASFMLKVMTWLGNIYGDVLARCWRCVGDVQMMVVGCLHDVYVMFT